MTSSTEEIKKIFEYELKRKVSERSRLEYKYLINCFKFYDINGEGEIEKNKWISAILKTGITGFTESDLESLYNTYVTNSSDKIDYKDFCNYLYGRERTDALSKSLKNKNTTIENDNSSNNTNDKKRFYNNIQNIDLNQYNKNYTIRQNKGYENSLNLNNRSNNANNNIYSNRFKSNKYNYNKSNINSNNEEKGLNESDTLINKIKETIHVDNGLLYYTFLKFLKINEEPTTQKVSLEDLSVTIQELHLNISSTEIHDFYNYLDSEKTGRIPTDNILNLIKGSLSDKRKSILNEIFSYIDTEKKGEISLNNFKDMYNAKNHPDVSNGIKSEQEIYNQFCYTIDVYIRVNKILNNSITKEQFVDYYSGISPSIENDKDFQNILEKVWNVDQQKYKYKNKYNYLSDNYDNAYGNNDIGINSIFLGISRTKRPNYNYNYDYLEEFSKSSPNLINNKKTINNSNTNNNGEEDRNILRGNNTNKQNTHRYNSRNKHSDIIGETSLNNNQAQNYSNTLPVRNYNALNDENKKYFNYESKKTRDNKGIRVFKSKRYNPITDEYIEDNNNISETVETNNTNFISQEIIKKIQTPNNNLYTINTHRQSNSQNSNLLKEEINKESPENIKENEINNENDINPEEENKINIINLYQNNNLKENASLIKFRNLLISRGNKSIFLFQRMLSIYDRNHSGLISFNNFYTIFQAYYMNFPLSDIKSIFSLFDTTSPNNNEAYKDSSLFKIKYDDLLKSIIGNISTKRQLIVKKVFDSFSKDKDGKIMTNDIKSKFNYKNHPEVLNGKYSANEVYSDFLDFLETFREYNDNLKGGYSFNMSFEEFLEFYNEISMSIEDDDYFEKMLINCWDLTEESSENQNQISQENNNINNHNEILNSNNISNSYRRRNQYNSQNNNTNIQNLRMKVGSQIVNNKIF